jgi:hypothetical protein
MAIQRVRQVALVLVSVLLLPQAGAAEKRAVPGVSSQPSVGGAPGAGKGGNVQSRAEARVWMEGVPLMILGGAYVVFALIGGRKAPKGWGHLRLRVKPEHAEVFVDGYSVGLVDQFNGVFQRLHLEPGPHHIEFRADGYGYESLTYDVLIQPDRTMTYTGELKPIP